MMNFAQDRRLSLEIKETKIRTKLSQSKLTKIATALICCFLFLNLKTIYAIESGNEQLIQSLIYEKCLSVTEINREACGFATPILKAFQLKKKERRTYLFPLFQLNHDSTTYDDGIKCLLHWKTWNLIPKKVNKKNILLSKKSFKYVSISSGSANSSLLKMLALKSKRADVNFFFWHVNDSYIEIEPTDLLIINSLATYHHLTSLLETLAKNVSRYICIPSMYKNGVTCEKEEFYKGNYLDYPGKLNKSENSGVWTAIHDFLKFHPEWEALPHNQYTDFLILQRVSNSGLLPNFVLDPLTEFYLNNKIILCTGPSLGRKELLKYTIESESRLIPYKKIFIRTNDDNILDIQLPDVKFECKKIPLIERYVDCWNCLVSSLKDAIEDKDILDDDLILFKHESVFLNDLNLFKRALSKIICGYDMLVRNYFLGSATDIFLVKVSAIKEVIARFAILEQLPPDKYVELIFHEEIVLKTPRVYGLYLGEAPFKRSSNTSSWGSNGLGFYHLHAYFRFSKSKKEWVDIFGQCFWNKKNYNTIYHEEKDISELKYYHSLSELIPDWVENLNEGDLEDVYPGFSPVESIVNPLNS